MSRTWADEDVCVCQDTSGGLFDDMELVYNTSPSMHSLDATLQADVKLQVTPAPSPQDTPLGTGARLTLLCGAFLPQHCFSGFPRLGIMRMPALSQAKAPPPLCPSAKAPVDASQGSARGPELPSEAHGEGEAVVPAPSHSLYIFGNFPVAGEVSTARAGLHTQHSCLWPSDWADLPDAVGPYLALLPHTFSLRQALMCCACVAWGCAGPGGEPKRGGAA